MLAHFLPLLSVALVVVAWTATIRLLRRRQLPISQALIIFCVLLAIGLLAASRWLIAPMVWLAKESIFLTFFSLMFSIS